MHKTFALIVLLIVTTTAAIAAADVTGSRYQQPVGAADYDDPFIAAGFRALFTCSAYFHGKRKLSDILEIELRDTAALGLPTPVIDADRALVLASDGSANQRIAAWRESLGCTLLPPDVGLSGVAHLPTIYRNPPDARPLPQSIDSRYDDLLEVAFDGETFGDGTITAGVVIAKDGEIVTERYGNGFTDKTAYRTWSTAKSITSVLIGIAVKERLISLDEPVAIPEFAAPGDPRSKITWRHLLNMSSGLYSEGANTNALYFGGQDAVSAATSGHQEEAPGSRWKYANNDTLLLLYGLRNVLGDDLAYLRYPYDKLIDVIGMSRTVMETDHAGNYIGSSQVYTTPRDLARFGQFLLQDGTWNGVRVLPAGWIETVTTPAPAKPSEPGDWGYGGQFWLMGGIDGLPTDAYTTAGNKGQLVTVLPSQNLVVVRTGVDPLGKRWDQNAFVRAILEPPSLNQPVDESAPDQDAAEPVEPVEPADAPDESPADDQADAQPSSAASG